MKIASLRNFYLYFLLFAPGLSVISGCSKSSPSAAATANLPTVATTNVIINLTSTMAQSGGVIVNNGGAVITKNGVCYSTTNKTPTTADIKTSDSVSTSGDAIIAFASNLSNLTPNTTYYLRAYATNSAGTGYGGVLKFTTPSTGNTYTGIVTTFAGSGTSGYLDGAAMSAQFNNPEGVSVDSKGNVFVSDAFNNVIREISSAGSVSTVAGTQGAIGFQDGKGTNAEFYSPAGSAVDAQGNIYVADRGNNVIRKITPDGTVSTYAGTGTAGYRNGAATSAYLKSSSDSLAMFNGPTGVAVDASGNVYVADRGNNVIRKILPTGRTMTVAGNIVKGFIDATGAVALFNHPSGVVIDSKGDLYVTDEGNSALRKVTSAGVVSTIIGNPVQTDILNIPSALAIDANDNVFIVDEGGRVFEYNSSNNALYFLAGSLTSGLTNGTGSSVRFNYPQSIAVDGQGNIYIADQYNNVIRKMNVQTVNAQ